MKEDCRVMGNEVGDKDSPMKIQVRGLPPNVPETSLPPSSAPASTGRTPTHRERKTQQQQQQQHAPLPPSEMGEYGGSYMYPAMASQTYNMYSPAAMSPYMNMPYMPYTAMPPWPQMYPPMPMQFMQGGMAQAAMPQLQASASGAASSPKGSAVKPPNANRGKNREQRRREQRRQGKAKGAREQRPLSPASSPTAAGEDKNVTRSPELLEVRKQGTKPNSVKFTLAEINALEFAQDQYGSRYLQSKFEDATDAEKVLVFDTILPEAEQLATHVFANHVIQKLFELGNADQRKSLVTKLNDGFLNLSKDTYGCRVVQKAIQYMSRESQMMLANELQKDVLGCIENMHGNHVIQKCIEQMPPDSVNFIIKAVEEQTVRWAQHMFGCRVIQRLFEHCAPQQLEPMVEQILNSVPLLAKDPYGNYVVQHMLEHGPIEDTKRIIEIIRTNLLDFAKQKYSSNLVEKCFEVATTGENAKALDDERKQLMRVVLGEPHDLSPPLNQMWDDKFGNYIVQRMLELTFGDEKKQLYRQLNAAKEQLGGSANGKHILAKLPKEYTGQTASG